MLEATVELEKAFSTYSPKDNPNTMAGTVPTISKPRNLKFCSDSESSLMKITLNDLISFHIFWRKMMITENDVPR